MQQAVVHSRLESVRLMRPLAWSLVLIASTLPDIVLREWLDMEIGGLLGFKVAALGLAFLATLFWAGIRPLRMFPLFLLAILGLEYGRAALMRQSVWAQLTARFPGGFVGMMLGDQISRVTAAAVMIGLLLLLGYSARRAYLMPGDLHAPIGATPLLGFKAGETNWARFGFLGGLAVGLGTLLFLVLAGGLPPRFLARWLPLLPAILLFATMNAFAEEVVYRSSLLASLRGVFGRTETVMLAAVFFGLAHYYGVPYGIVGVLMSTALGWFMGKAMVETDGLFWPWFIHFVQDVLIFSILAVGTITPGG